MPINRLADKRSIWIRNDPVGVHWKLATVISRSKCVIAEDFLRKDAIVADRCTTIMDR